VVADTGSHARLGLGGPNPSDPKQDPGSPYPNTKLCAKDKALTYLERAYAEHAFD